MTRMKKNKMIDYIDKSKIGYIDKSKIAFDNSKYHDILEI